MNTCEKYGYHSKMSLVEVLNGEIHHKNLIYLVYFIFHYANIHNFINKL